MALNGSISLSSSKAWKGSVDWEVSGGKLYLSLYMWKTDGTNNPSSGGSTSSGSVSFNGSEVISFTYGQLEYGKTQYGQTYETSFSYNTSYSISASVNGLGNTSLSGYTLSGNGTINVNRYNLSINEDVGSSVLVKRTSSDVGSTGTLNNGSYIYNGDVLQISFSALTGYSLGTCTVNDGAFTSGNTHTVSSAVYISSTAEPNSYRLTMKQGTGSSITAYRQSSESSSGSTGYLNNGSTIYYNDKIKVIFDPIDGYEISTCTVNTSSFESESVYTVVGDTTIESSAIVKHYLLTLNPDTGTEILVYRINSPLQGADNGELFDNATIYHSDVLEIEFSAEPGYQISQQLVNQKAFTSGSEHTVTGNVEIVTISGAAGLVNIYNGSQFDKYLIYIYNGSTWDQYMPYVYDGTDWVICS